MLFRRHFPPPRIGSGSFTNGSVVFTFDIPDTSKEYYIYYFAGSGSSMAPAPVSMEVDGVTKAVSSLYTFSSLGTHTVELFFSDVGECAAYLAAGSDAVAVDVSNLSLPDSYNLSGFFSCSPLLQEVTGLRQLLSTLPTDDYYQTYSLFEFCPSLPSIDLSDLTFRTYNLSMWFWDCSSLRSVRMPNIEWGDPSAVVANLMFSGCSLLTSVDLSAFTNYPCSDFQSGFDGCTSLTSVVMPMSWTEKAYYGGITLRQLFMNCTSLSSIRFNHPVPNTADPEDLHIENMFTGIRSSGKFYYPSGMSSSILSALPSGWSKVLI